MSKYHKIILDKEEFILRDVTVSPFTKKFRVATLYLKEKFLDKISRDEDIELIKFFNRKIHFYIKDEYFNLSDDELSDYLMNNVNELKNDIIYSCSL